MAEKVKTVIGCSFLLPDFNIADTLGQVHPGKNFKISENISEIWNFSPMESTLVIQNNLHYLSYIQCIPQYCRY